MNSLRWGAGAAVVVIGIGLLLQLNTVLVVVTAAAAVSAVLAFLHPKTGLAILFGWIAAADLLKRLLFLGVAPGGPPASETEYFWMLVLPDLVLFALLIRAGYGVLRTRRLPFSPNAMDILVAAYFGWCLLTVLNPTFPLSVRLAGFKWSGIYILIFFVVREQDSRGRDWLVPLRGVVVAGGVAAAAYGLYQAAFGFQDFEMEWLESGLTNLGGGEGGLGPTISYLGIVRPFSIFASHEQLGWFLAFAMLIMLTAPRRSPLQWAMIVLLDLALARTLSRSAWVFLAGGLGLVTVLALYSRRKKLSVEAVSVGLVFLIAVAFWSQRPIEEQGQVENPYSERATTLGTYAWRIYSFEQLLQDPQWRRPFGNGIGSMWVAWRMGAEGTKNPDERILSHIGSVDQIYELGWVGFLIFLAAVGTIAVKGVKRLRRLPEDSQRLLIVGLSVVLAVVLANSTVATVLMFRPIAAPFWVALGMAAGALAQPEQGITVEPMSSS